jgi:hypothetical protein
LPRSIGTPIISNEEIVYIPIGYGIAHKEYTYTPKAYSLPYTIPTIGTH